MRLNGGTVVFLFCVTFANAALGATPQDRIAANSGLYGGTEPVSSAHETVVGRKAPFPLMSSAVTVFPELAMPGPASIEVDFNFPKRGRIKLAGLAPEPSWPVPAEWLETDLSDRYRLPMSTVEIQEDRSRIPGPSYTPNPFLQESGFAQSQRLQADRTVLGR